MGSGLQATVIAVLALLGTLVVWKVAGPPERLKEHEVELSTIMSEWGGEVVWVDARKRAEWERNGMPDSVLINTDSGEDLDTLVAESLHILAPADRLVVYCGTAGCETSLQVARILREEYLAGVGPKCYALYGGVQTLIDAGLISGSK